MINTKKIIKCLREHIVKTSDREPTNYRIAKLLNTSPTAVYNWDKKGAIMTDQCAKEAALLMGYDPAFFIASCAVERGLLNSPCKKEWREIKALFDGDIMNKRPYTTPKTSTKGG